MLERIHRSIHILVLAIATLSWLVIGGSTQAIAATHSMSMSAGKAATAPVDIVRDPADVPAPVGNRQPGVVHVTLTAKEVVGRLDPSTQTNYRYWTFNGKLPGPMIRVRQGDTVEVTLKNDANSHMAHSVDFHAALGPGGGAAFSQALPGQSKTFTFRATTAGLFVYHCGTPMIAEHIANGMFGMILVEPPGGLPHVDHEYYVMQSEIYTKSQKGTAGMQDFSATKLMDEHPEYFVFNGAVDGLVQDHPLRANAGDTVRIFFGDAGPNRPSSLHVVGEIFTKEYPSGALGSAPLTGVQTAMVAPGSAAILELKATTPGKFNFMDHAMARMAKGLMGTIEVTGPENAGLMHPGPASEATNTMAFMLSGMTAADAADAVTVTQERPDSSMEGMRPMQPDMTMSEPAVTARMIHASTRRSHPASKTRVSPILGANSSTGSPTQLNGCLTFANALPMLQVSNSDAIYRLQARPLRFAEHPNQLVRVTGYVGSVIPGVLSTQQSPSFVVDTIDELAPNCAVPVTRALLQEFTAKENAKKSDDAENASTADTDAAKANAITIGMGSMAFNSPKITIKTGQRIVWKNTSETIHNVVDDTARATNKADVQVPHGAKSFHSEFLKPGQTFSHIFTVPGIYRYVCTLHEDVGMKAEIVVK